MLSSLVVLSWRNTLDSRLECAASCTNSSTSDPPPQFVLVGAHQLLGSSSEFLVIEINLVINPTTALMRSDIALVSLSTMTRKMSTLKLSRALN